MESDMSYNVDNNISSSKIKKVDSLNALKETLKQIEINIDVGTTETDKNGRILSYHEAHLKKCIENDKFTTIYKQLPIEEQIAWMTEKYEKICKHLPKSLITLLPGIFHCGVSSGSLTKIPDWLDMEKFRKGQQFAKDNHASLWLSMVYGLNLIFFFEDGLQPLLLSRKSITSYGSFKRYIITIRRMDEIFFGEPWTEGSLAQRELKYIRTQHRLMWNILHKYDDTTLHKASTLKEPYTPSYELLRKDLQATCPIPPNGQCPFDMWTSENTKRKAMSQIDMAFVQFSFIGFIILKPEMVGIHDATDENIEAFCHMWKGIAYLLGIKDEFNLCNGTVEEIRQRLKDMLKYWMMPNFRNYTKSGEHVLRVFYEGTSYYYPLCTYEMIFLQISEALNLDVTNFRASLSYSTLIYNEIFKFAICRLTALKFFKKLLNMSFDYAKNRALNFDAKKHAELQEKSSKSMLNTTVIQPLSMAQ